MKVSELREFISLGYTLKGKTMREKHEISSFICSCCNVGLYVCCSFTKLATTTLQITPALAWQCIQKTVLTVMN
jgi:hypothetical protein